MTNALVCTLLCLAATSFAQGRASPPKRPPPKPATSPGPASAPPAAVAPTAPAAPGAPARLGLQLALKAGGTLAFSKLSPAVFGGLEASYALPVFDRRLAAGVELGFAQPGRAASGSSGTAGDYSYRLTQRLVTFALDVTYAHPLGALTAFGGAGWGVYHLVATVESFGMTNTERQLRSGLQLRGGAGMAVGPGTVFGELRLHQVGLQFLSTGEATGGGATVALGYRLHL